MALSEKQKASRLIKRTSNIYRHQRERAQQYGVQLPYGLGQLRDLVSTALDKQCPYCDVVLDYRNFSVDHSEPVSRGGSFALDDLCVICMRCNQVKGNMNEGEFTRLLWLLREFQADVARNILARLRAGGRLIRA